MRRSLIAVAMLFCSTSLAAKEMYIPVAGYLQGAGGTFFRTDVRIFNPESRPIAISMHFLPAHTSGAGIPGTIVNLEPREMLVLDNIVAEFFEMPSGSIGAIWMDSWYGAADYEFNADSRTYTNDPVTSLGTYGQFIPAVEHSTAKRKSVVLHLSNLGPGVGGYRSNAGIMNPHFEDATVMTSLFRADGTQLGTTATWNVPSKSVIQHPVAAMADLGSVDFTDGYLVVESSVPVFAYGSVVDNVSSDQIYVAASEDIRAGDDIVITPDCATPAPLHLTQFAAEGWIVVFNDGVNGIDETARLSEEYEFTATYTYSGGGFEGFAAHLTAETIAKLRCEASVKYVQQNARGSI